MKRTREAWESLRKGRPGERFEARFHRLERGPRMRRLLRVCLGALSILVGVVLLFIPGPGIVFLAGGAALLAEESLVVARLLDRLEVHVRRLLRGAAAAWRRRSAAARVALILATLVTAAGAVLLASRAVMRGFGL